MGSGLFWILVIGVFGVYAALLAGHLFRSQSASRQTKAKTASAKEGQKAATGTNVESAAQVARAIEKKIAAWNGISPAILGAQSLEDQGLVDEAVQSLAHALEATPHAAPLQTRLAQLYVKQKEYDKAKDRLIDILEANPDDTGARLILASVFDSLENHEAALAVAKWVLDVDPNSAEANQIAANSYLALDRKALAISHLKKIVSVEHDNLAAQNKLALAYVQLGEYVKAIQIFNELIDKNAADSMSYFNLAVCYAKQGMAEQSVEVLTHATSILGKSFVDVWMKSQEFDGIRQDPLFVALGKQGPKPDERKPKPTTVAVHTPTNLPTLSTASTNQP